MESGVTDALWESAESWKLSSQEKKEKKSTCDVGREGVGGSLTSVSRLERKTGVRTSRERKR